MRSSGTHARAWMRPFAHLAVITAMMSAGCEPEDPRRAVAEQFIDRLFVTIDQASARELAVGLATAKIDEEIKLTAGQEIDETTRKPSVHYSFLQRAGADGDETVSLVYELRIAPDGTDSFTRRLILMLRRLPEGWRVANYTLEAPAEPD